MDAEERKRILDAFTYKIILPLINRLSAMADSLRDLDLDAFQESTRWFLDEAKEGVARIAGIQAIEAAEDSTLRSMVAGYIVSAFNMALPINHPYVMACLFLKNSKTMFYIYAHRNTIPGWYELLHRAFIPVFETESQEAFERDGSMKFKRLISKEDGDDPDLAEN